jgi:hypothetical protein
MVRTIATLATAVLCVFGAFIAVTVLAREEPGTSPCAIAQGPTALPGIPEASGLTLSRRTAGLLWSHNDSGTATLFAVDGSRVRGQVAVPSATVVDWEDVTAARCPSGDCLYIADIGDNDRTRTHVTIYRVSEPTPDATQTAVPDVFTMKYPDGPHDAEALFIVADGLFLITKDTTAALYRASLPLAGRGEIPLQRAGSLALRHVTDADASPDGSLVAVRTNDELVFYRTAELTRGAAKPRGVTVSLRALKEPQGEGVAVGPDGSVYLASEGSGGAGRLTSLHCTLPQ